MEQFIVKGKIVYNEVRAEGESEKGVWKRSELVIECVSPKNGKLYCRVFSYLADRKLPMAVGMPGEFKYIVDKREVEGKTFSSCRIIDYTAIDEDALTTTTENAAPKAETQPQELPSGNNNGGIPF